MATIVIGDVHGCLDELQHLVGVLRPGPADDLILVGDLISKGPDSRGVVAWARESANVRCVLGNHELRYIQAAKQGRKPAEKPYDAETVRQLGPALDDAVRYFETLPARIQTAHWMIVHAGFDPGKPVEAQPAEMLTNIRRLADGHTPWYEVYDAPRLVVFGHWVHREPLLRQNVTGIDTGCVYGNKLTALVLPERRLVSVRARREYAARKNWA